MTRLEYITARRGVLLLEIQTTRESICAGVRRVRGALAPVVVGFSIGRLLAGAGWLRWLAAAGVVMTAVKRWRSR